MAVSAYFFAHVHRAPAHSRLDRSGARSAMVPNPRRSGADTGGPITLDPAHGEGVALDSPAGRAESCSHSPSQRCSSHRTCSPSVPSAQLRWATGRAAPTRATRHRRLSHCAAEAPYQSGIYFIVAMDASGGWGLGFAPSVLANSSPMKRSRSTSHSMAKLNFTFSDPR